MQKFSYLTRDLAINNLKNKKLDLLIIGGGITGAGVALDAITRGLSVGLIEMGDFAQGTSSKSTKLVHGGLRYLKQLEIKEVASLGKERAIVYENGPHVTTPIEMLLPFYKKGTFGPLSTSLGLKVYDILAKVKRSEQRKMISKNKVIEKVPFINKESLLGGGLYVEYRTDDARLTIEVIKEAAKLGAKIVNYTEAIKFTYENGKITGVITKDGFTHKTYTISARSIVNATGPWVDDLLKLDNTIQGETKHLQLSKGVHLVFSRKNVPLKQALYFDTFDKRMIFAIPREDKVYIGTTDTYYEKDLKEITITQEDRDYILSTIRYIFPNLNITENQIESSWAGIRPLINQVGKKTAEISRKDEIWLSDTGLLTIAGGKLTGYRKMAEKIVNRIVKTLKAKEGIIYSKSKTINLPISGGHIGGSKNLPTFLTSSINKLCNFKLTYEQSSKLARMYGSNIIKLYPYLEKNTTNLPNDLYAQLMYAINYEMTLTPVDFFKRRNASLFFDIEQVNLYKKDVINVMSNLLNWSFEQKELFITSLNKEIYIATSATKTEKL